MRRRLLVVPILCFMIIRCPGLLELQVGKQIRKAHGDDLGTGVIDEVSNLSFRFRLKPQASSPRFAGVRVPGAKSYYVYQQLPCDPEILILIDLHEYNETHHWNSTYRL